MERGRRTASGCRTDEGNRILAVLPYSRRARRHSQGGESGFFYCIKNGFNDGVFSRKVPTGIHAIFRESEFHGDIYAYVSPWLSEVMACGKAPWVPHMVQQAEEFGDLRAEIGIPKDEAVFGRHGGMIHSISHGCRRLWWRPRGSIPKSGFFFSTPETFQGPPAYPILGFCLQRQILFANDCFSTAATPCYMEG